MQTEPFSERELLRHALAAMVYRATRAVEHVHSTFGTFRPFEGSRTPVQILAHMGDLCDWALTIAKGHELWRDAVPQTWESEVSRFYECVKTLDNFLAGPSPLSCLVPRLLQGPVADALTHIGQLAMLRRMSGDPMRGENFFLADIEAGRVGPDQAPPKRTFD